MAVSESQSKEELQQHLTALGSYYNLSDFLRQNDMTLQSLGVLVALTVFSRDYASAFMSNWMSFIFLLLAGIVFLELRQSFPTRLQLFGGRRHHIDRIHFVHQLPTNRLSLFAIFLDASFVLLVLYDLWEYLGIWEYAARVVVLYVGFFLIPYGCYFIRLRRLDMARRFTHRAYRKHPYRYILVVGIVAIGLQSASIVIHREAEPLRKLDATHYANQKTLELAVWIFLFLAASYFLLSPDFSRRARERKLFRMAQQDIHRYQEQPDLADGQPVNPIS